MYNSKQQRLVNTITSYLESIGSKMLRPIVFDRHCFTMTVTAKGEPVNLAIPYPAADKEGFGSEYTLLLGSEKYMLSYFMDHFLRRLV